MLFKLSEVLQPECVRVPLLASDKASAIDALCRVLADAGLGDFSQIHQAVMDREAARSTGIGLGVAIPHGKVPGLKQLGLAVGIPQEPLAWQAIDGQPVRFILMLISPEGDNASHIQALAKVSRLLGVASVREAIFKASDAASALRLIAEHEA